MLTTDPVPKKNGLYVPYDNDEVIEVGAHRFGPELRPLLPYTNRMSMLRGIYCDVLNHPQARIRMCSGKFRDPEGKAIASVQGHLAEHFGGAYEIPNLSSDTLRPGTFRGHGQPEKIEPVRVTNVEQLKSLLGWKNTGRDARKAIEQALAQKDAMTTARYGQFTALPGQVETFNQLARASLDSQMADRVRDTGNIVTETLSDNALTIKNSGNAELAVEAIKLDLAPVITVGTGEFDAHTRAQYAGHRSAVSRGMTTVANICAGLDAVRMPGNKTLLDHTTVVVTSEFSRDPMKNELGGKHHWMANSMIIIGKGTKANKSGPTVFGGCDDGLASIKINPDSGSFKKNVEDIDMSHGLATVLAMGGLDPVRLIGQDPIPALMG